MKNLPAMQEMWSQSLGQEDPLEEEMATHSSILFFFFLTTPVSLPGKFHVAWRATKVGHDLARTHLHRTHACTGHAYLFKNHSMGSNFYTLAFKVSATRW